LGENFCDVIIAMHYLTGSDSTNKFGTNLLG